MTDSPPEPVGTCQDCGHLVWPSAAWQDPDGKLYHNGYYRNAVGNVVKYQCGPIER